MGATTQSATVHPCPAQLAPSGKCPGSPAANSQALLVVADFGELEVDSEELDHGGDCHNYAAATLATPADSQLASSFVETASCAMSAVAGSHPPQPMCCTRCSLHNAT
jgi:hypothetical protein